VQASVGAAFVPFHEPMKPNVVLAAAATLPLCDAFVAVTAEPLVATVAFQAWDTVCPLANVIVTRQPPIGDEPAVTRTSPWKPPVHWLVTA
jgi:hypothetical protein